MAYSIGRGSKVSIGRKISPATTFTFTELKGVTGIEVPSIEFDEVETTNFGSPGFSREFIPGLYDAGDITLEVLYDPGSATDAVLAAAFASRETVQIKFEIVGTTEDEIWSGYLKGYNLEISDAEAIKKNPVFRISNKVES